MSIPKVKLIPQPIPKSVLRSAVAGDFMRNLGEQSAQTIRNVQQGVAEGLIAGIIVTGINAINDPKERYLLEFDPLTEDTKVTVDTSDGKSTLEALDVGLAGAVAYAIATMKRKGLRPVFNYQWSRQAQATPAYLAEACRRLGFIMDVGPLPSIVQEAAPRPTPAYSTPNVDQMPPLVDAPTPVSTTHSSYRPQPTVTTPAGYEYKTMATITPVKDSGIHFSIQSLRKK